MLKRVDTDSAVLGLIKRLLGFDARELVSLVSDTDYARIVNERVAVYHSVTEVTFGTVPRALSALFQRVTGFHTFYRRTRLRQRGHPQRYRRPRVQERRRASATPAARRVRVDHRDLAQAPRRGSGPRAHDGAAPRRRQQPARRRLRVRRRSGRLGTLVHGESVERIVGEPVAPLDSLFGRLVARIVPDDQANFLASIERAVTTQTVWDCESRLRTAHGTTITFSGHAEPRLVEGTVIFDGMLLDITDQRHAEQAAREHQAIVDAIVESSVSIWAMDAEGRHTYSNPAVQRILGVSPGPGRWHHRRPAAAS